MTWRIASTPRSSLLVGTLRCKPRDPRTIARLSDAHDRNVRARQQIQQCVTERLERVVMPIGRPGKRTGHPHEWPGDHASHAEPSADHVEGNLADSVLLGNRNDVFVRGNLKHAVGGGVDDRLAGLDVLDAEALDDFGAGGDDVADRAAADPPLELSDEIGRKPVRKRRKRPVEDDAHHLPMPGYGILSRRRFSHPAVCTSA